ncbi:hypothetical protein RI129_011117 [Pyrocoelia pectoralis]|uniref:RING-type domain-containing protein n=1 Tax=Pyrocoelia pectoralis TaxID=417401 RepID=A0AAN7V8A7_9COLE
MENKEKRSSSSQSQQMGQSCHDCPICCETLENTNMSATVCGHVFCTKCIVQAIRVYKTCPTCRTKLTLKKIHPLYL